MKTETYKNSSIVILGSGNMAWHLAYVFTQAKIQVKQIISRSKLKGEALAKEIHSQWSDFINYQFQPEDLLFLAVSDNVIQEVLSKIQLNDASVVHTSGSIPLSAIRGYTKNYGVFYPFQTLTKEVLVDFKEVPVCIESNSNTFTHQLQKLASRISGKVLAMNSEERKVLHISGVMANNFTNHLLSHVFDILNEHQISPELLIPLLKETVRKAALKHPSNVQTGPAVRGNDEIIREHVDFLNGKKELQELYILFSKSIQNYYSQQKKDE